MEWIINYNERRSHDNLCEMPPVVYRELISMEVSPSQVNSRRDLHWIGSDRLILLAVAVLTGSLD